MKFLAKIVLSTGLFLPRLQSNWTVPVGKICLGTLHKPNSIALPPEERYFVFYLDLNIDPRGMLYGLEGRWRLNQVKMIKKRSNARGKEGLIIYSS